MAPWLKPVCESILFVSRASPFKQYKEMIFFIANSFDPTFRELYSLLMESYMAYLQEENSKSELQLF